jgi:hypothetical protein
MIIIKKYTLLIFTFFVLQSVVSATGPSWIESKIRPISINENGDILCRTRFSKNEMGAHRAMKIVYGYCIITTDSIIEYKTHVIEPDEFPAQDLKTLDKITAFRDSIFYSNFDINRLCETGHTIKKRYSFKHCNVSSYRVDKVLSINDFQKSRNINLETTHQKALNGAISTEYLEEKTIHVLYDFGNILIIKNEDQMEGPGTGARFNYPKFWTDKNGVKRDIGFDISFIDGVLVIN